MLSEALSSSMLYMAFGIPKVIQRSDAQVGKIEAAKDVKN